MNPRFLRSLPRNFFLTVTVVATGFWYWSGWISEPPLLAPIDLATPGSMERTVHLRVAQPYELSFEFTRGSTAHDRVTTLIGEMGLCGLGSKCAKGTPIEVEWNLINSITESPVAGARVTTSDASGFSNLEVWRRIGEINVPTGEYRIRLAVLQSAPELNVLKPAVRLSLYPKDTTSWQMFAVWWGTLVLPFIALPVVLTSAYVWYRSKNDA